MIHAPLRATGNQLYMDDVSVQHLVEFFDTPLYIMSENRIRDNFRRLKGALDEYYSCNRILYSAKANTNINILRIIQEEGGWVDAVSLGEVFLALESGFKPEEILFTGTSVREDEIKQLKEWNILINIDSLSQAKKILREEAPEKISVRLNPEIGAGHHEHVITAGPHSKFGLSFDNALKAFEIAVESGVENFGVQMHIGSGMLDFTQFYAALENFLSFIGEIVNSFDIEFDFIDIGGGLGVPYRPEEKPAEIRKFANNVVNVFKKKCYEHQLNEPELWLEPGRYLVADAGILVTRVNTIKKTSEKHFCGVDAGMNTLIRPALYGSYHHILVANKLDHPNERSYDIVGPICESSDFFAKDRLLPKVEEGDVLAILSCGAYGFSMASQYNSRPKPPEILVKGGEYKEIRRRETLQDLIKNQIIK